MPVIDPASLIRNRVHAIRQYHAETGIQRAELDLSGGIDSATMLALLCRALGPEKVTAVYTGLHSSPDSLARAREAASACAASLVEMELTELYEDLYGKMTRALQRADHDLQEVERRLEADPSIAGSIRSCLRAPVGRGLNRLTGGGLRHGTGNECEDRFLRFYQKGGDGEVDSNPIAMLSKGEVYQLAIALELPRSILVAVPSPDLHATGDAHTDEGELQSLYEVAWTYSRVDPDSGQYSSVGSIERTCRFLDLEGTQALLFGPAEPSVDQLQGLVSLARETTFVGYAVPELEKFLLSARKAERSTRHKANPNCPTLGVRKDLLLAGILSNDLPEI